MWWCGAQATLKIVSNPTGTRDQEIKARSVEVQSRESDVAVREHEINTRMMEVAGRERELREDQEALQVFGCYFLLWTAAYIILLIHSEHIRFLFTHLLFISHHCMFPKIKPNEVLL